MITYASGLQPTISTTKTVIRHGNTYEVVTTNRGDPVEVYVIKRRRYSPAFFDSGPLTYRSRITSERKIKDVLRNGIYVA